MHANRVKSVPHGECGETSDGKSSERWQRLCRDLLISLTKIVDFSFANH